MQYQRRQIEDSRRQRWEDTPEAQKYAAWFTGWERRVRLLKLATITFAIISCVWLPVAWTMQPTHPIALTLFFAMFAPGLYAAYRSIKPR